ncbi:hypothetical protein ABC628_07760 [Lentilactobacillus otakiensis]|jgi:hypothetical protein|uniref:Uncharacterized protein n=1 Tax=Lentilactobacillus otakiensis DSM 19908 = JCM 15040 TaxID=1423780 RepID=S4NU04_9LACO|nr:hypothetical protein [Lentilactobacillus otakiensis]KRL08584.1 hypothetical protein FD05_GL001749 [Lentilactobacillus otakiensis DSM 19908 = JCM 15040]MBZ3777633.1 hypothetical protein [Lentilactobacillus otakiensis]MDV3518688.1 hypothetical protein [Lentilactobacillus otakiensis]GAD17448.1 conserved hypothetical protein [Lentilactobacillus otakiensis DSM 19908 = JCM 15040]
MNIDLIIQIIIGLVAAFAVYNLIHYIFVTRPGRKRLALAQRIANEAVKSSINKLVEQKSLSPFDESDFKSEDIAEVWGRGVMAFEYHLPVTKINNSILEFRQALSNTLEQYGDNHHMHAHTEQADRPAFMVTDVWQLDDRVHFDVAYLINTTTIEYVDDLKRLH